MDTAVHQIGHPLANINNDMGATRHHLAWQGCTYAPGIGDSYRNPRAEGVGTFNIKLDVYSKHATQGPSSFALIQIKPSPFLKTPVRFDVCMNSNLPFNQQMNGYI